MRLTSPIFAVGLIADVLVFNEEGLQGEGASVDEEQGGARSLGGKLWWGSFDLQP